MKILNNTNTEQVTGTISSLASKVLKQRRGTTCGKEVLPLNLSFIKAKQERKALFNA